MSRPQNAQEWSNRDQEQDQRSANGGNRGGHSQYGGNNRHHQHQHPYQRNWSNHSNQSNNHNNYRGSNFNRPPQTNRAGCFQIDSEKLASFYVHPHSMYRGQFPSLSQPVEVGIVLSDKRRVNLAAKKSNGSGEQQDQIVDKNYGIKYLVMPAVPTNLSYDLKLGIEHFVQHIPHEKGIDLILKWIADNSHHMLNKAPTATGSGSLKPLAPDFVCWRGLLTALACSPYEKNKDNMFSIILFKGTYYLCEIETESQKQERLNMTDQNRAFTYWGHKFESYITVDSPAELPNGAADVPDPEDNYGAAIMSDLDKMKLFYCAEIDCCMQKEHARLSDYCEIKTARGSGLKDLNIEKNLKFMKWWVQSFLAGIEKIIIGFRNDEGIVHGISDIQTRELVNKNPVS